jgi:hypothetical protein
MTFSDLSQVKGSTGNAFGDLLDETDGSEQLRHDRAGWAPVSSFQQDSGQGRYRQRYQIVEPYFQDDFKVNSLTSP